MMRGPGDLEPTGAEMPMLVNTLDDYSQSGSREAMPFGPL